MTIKRMFDTEMVNDDTLYSYRGSNISENEDVVYPNIRYNFYRTSDSEIYLMDNDLVHMFMYKPEMNKILPDKGYFIIKTIYYKGIDIDTIDKFISLYIKLGYSNTNNNEYINKLTEIKENYRFNANIRLIYFIPEKVVNEYKVFNVDSFIIIKDINEYGNKQSKINSNDLGLPIKLFYVDFITPSDSKIIQIDEKVKLRIPIVKNKDLPEGLYLDTDGKEHRLNRFLGDLSDDISTTSNKLASFTKDRLESKVNDEINLKKEIRKIAYEKYRDIIDLTKMEIKFNNDIKTLEYTNDLSLAKAEKDVELSERKLTHEIKLKEMRAEEQQVSSAFGFIKDVLKLL